MCSARTANEFGAPKEVSTSSSFATGPRPRSHVSLSSAIRLTEALHSTASTALDCHHQTAKRRVDASEEVEKEGKRGRLDRRMMDRHAPSQSRPRHTKDDRVGPDSGARAHKQTSSELTDG